MTGSLGFATDLALRVLEGAVLEGATFERGPEATVVRTPANPRFRWGNFVLAPSADPGPEVLAAAHRVSFPDAEFVAIGIDDPAAEVDEPTWTSAGFTVERLVVLVASTVPQAVPVHARPLATQDDWDAVLAIESDEAAEPDDPGFQSARIRQRQALVATGRAVWFGVEVDGEVVTTLGVFDAGDGVARFQDVQTLRAHRRRGHAGALVAFACAAAAARFGSRRFVIVAEAQGAAIGIYRRLGFVEAETQVLLERLPAGGD